MNYIRERGPKGAAGHSLESGMARTGVSKRLPLSGDVFSQPHPAEVEAMGQERGAVAGVGGQKLVFLRLS